MVMTPRIPFTMLPYNGDSNLLLWEHCRIMDKKNVTSAVILVEFNQNQY